MTNILICTVGGSHQPIVSAIIAQKPDYVVFICTEKDPATGRPGSSIQITGVGNCIKANQIEEKPTLPNIPAQTGLNTDQFELVCTLADDLDRIYLDCSHAVEAALSRFPYAKMTADYTGGTKSMSAGLVMAVLDHQAIELQLVTGSRADLIKVQDGAQFASYANIEQIRFERLIAPYQQAWSRYAYGEAEAGLNRVSVPRSSGLRSEYSRFRDLSHAFAEWDNFNHPTTLPIIERYAPNLAEEFKPYLAIAKRLNDKKPAKREAAQLFDLYLNALRRAAQGRYDDAIARIYRLLEWTAQWLLKTQFGIDTANIDKSAIPTAMTLTENREGQTQAGLYAAWQLVKLKTSGEAHRFFNAEEKTMLNHLKIRNSSILAHGFAPVNANDWQMLDSWLSEKFMPMLLAETGREGLKEIPLQLPTQYRLRLLKQVIQ